MFRLNLKIALRNLWKNKNYTVINIGGLAVALAAFILVVMYVDYERSYDGQLINHKNIYLVGRTLSDSKTNYTAPPMAKAMKDAFPEIEKVGRTRKTNFELAFSSNQGRVYGKNVIQVDYELAQMFEINSGIGLKEPDGGTLDLYIPESFMSTLFGPKDRSFPKKIAIGPIVGGQTANVTGMLEKENKHSNLSYDALVIGSNIGTDENYEFNNYNTYIQVKEGTDIEALQVKIDALYKREMIKAGRPVVNDKPAVFLDALKNLHLKPLAGSDANYKIVMALTILGILVLVIACINFTNLTIAQTNSRAKEVGVKKVLGAYRLNLMLQFLIEIFMQCLLALVIGLILAEVLLPLFNNMFDASLSIWKNNNSLAWQLLFILSGITLISGIYPALILSGFKPVSVLKGNLQSSYKTLWLRNALLVTQFSVAIAFIACLLIVNSQLKYMRTADTGFKAGQVIYVKSIVSFERSYFEQLKEKAVKIPGVNYVTVASDIPDGSAAGQSTYTSEGKELKIDHLDVDFDYFETLNLKLKEGRFFDKKFNTDTANSAVLNESAVAKYGLINPVGKIIRGADLNYQIVGVVKDFKAQGFEKAVEPTIYVIKTPRNSTKIKLMMNVDQSRMAFVLNALKSQWKDINRIDSDDFRYEFLDELYGKLFRKQEQLQSIFYCAAALTIFIAILGLFAFSAFTTNNRRKEISVRKVLGASDFQILKMLNRLFIRVVILANVIGWPVAYIAATRWLNTFAYRIEVPVFPFVFAALITTVLTVITVSIQARKAVKASPVDALKYE